MLSQSSSVELGKLLGIRPATPIRKERVVAGGGVADSGAEGDGVSFVQASIPNVSTNSPKKFVSFLSSMCYVNVGFEHDIIFVKMVREVDVAVKIKRSLARKV